MPHGSRLLAYLQIMWAEHLVCRLFALNSGSLSDKSGFRVSLLADNPGSKTPCLQVLAFLFAGYYIYGPCVITTELNGSDDDAHSLEPVRTSDYV